MFSSLIKKSNNIRLIGVDIGSSSIKLVELDTSLGSRPKLLAMGSIPTPAGSITNNTISNCQKIADAIRSVYDNGKFTTKDAIVGIPGPSAFIKRISTGLTSLKDLQNNIQFEAANYIPHKVETVKMDFQVLGLSSRSTMEILLVAVKNEVIDSYTQAVSLSGLNPKIADIDYFALENMLELTHPEDKSKTIALLNIGSRYTSINIIVNGISVFTGDVGLGGRLYTDALCEVLGITASDAEKVKCGQQLSGIDATMVSETIDRTTEHVANELYKQIGFFWDAAVIEQPIDAIYLSGGGSMLPCLYKEIAEKGTKCQLINCFDQINWSAKFNDSIIKSNSLTMGVCVGLAIRRLGDKRHQLSSTSSTQTKKGA